ncbi:MAG TPA: response regulator, partial [Myxococcota bacterium]|nr:response regulator [Myxococcota bacterium]
MASKKILIVEPEKDFALSLAAVLSEGGVDHRFAFLETGKDVVDEAVAFRAELIILRAELPDGSGFGLVSRLRKPKKLKKTRIVLMTSDAAAEALEEHRRGKTPADHYVQIPFDMQAFRRAALELVGVAAPAGAEEPDEPEEPDVSALQGLHDDELKVGEETVAEPPPDAATLVAVPPGGL